MFLKKIEVVKQMKKFKILVLKYVLISFSIFVYRVICNCHMYVLQV